jgi:hypothetical protein
MINFRFHIVSLTAVLLALGIGLMLGTTFLDQATVDALRDRQETLEADVSRANERNEDQAAVIEANEREAEAFYDQIGERLFDGILTGEPVLVIATRGIEQDTVDQVMASIGAADARLLGTWWLTERMRLDDDGEVGDMGDALQLSTTDPARLRASLANQLADVLVSATDVEEAPGAAPGESELEAANDGAEPAVLRRLVEDGFVDYQMPDDAEQDVVALPSSGLRVVIVSGPEASVPPSELMVPVLIDFSANGPVPAVAVEPSIVIDEQSEESPIDSLVIDVRGDDDLVDRVSTVDDIDRAAGLAATVLATADADPGAPVVGHYGLGAGTRLLPEPPGAGE